VDFFCDGLDRLLVNACCHLSRQQREVPSS
jgi:hypothetical protein